jgi:hypothetical protein
MICEQVITGTVLHQCRDEWTYQQVICEQVITGTVLHQCRDEWTYQQVICEHVITGTVLHQCRDEWTSASDLWAGHHRNCSASVQRRVNISASDLWAGHHTLWSANMSKAYKQKKLTMSKSGARMFGYYTSLMKIPCDPSYTQIIIQCLEPKIYDTSVGPSGTKELLISNKFWKPTHVSVNRRV